MNFLFWLFLIGIVIASLQDLKRREVDNWLNLFLLVSSFAYLVFMGNSNLLLQGAFLLLVMAGIANLFYHGRVFAGGDAKLLFSMTLLFLGATFVISMTNILLFIVLLMISGSIYGIIYSGIIYFKNYEKVNKNIKNKFDFKSLKYYFIVAGILLAISYWNIVFLILAGTLFLFPFLYVFAKGLEEVVMTREIKGKDLREGDWLVNDVKIGKKIIRADWEGLTKENIEKLRRKKKVMIKEGIPFVPAFLIAFLIYAIFKEVIMKTIF